jgi:hypothetical protein
VENEQRYKRNCFFSASLQIGRSTGFKIVLASELTLRCCELLISYNDFSALFTHSFYIVLPPVSILRRVA